MNKKLVTTIVQLMHYNATKHTNIQQMQYQRSLTAQPTLLTLVSHCNGYDTLAATVSHQALLH